VAAVVENGAGQLAGDDHVPAFGLRRARRDDGNSHHSTEGLRPSDSPTRALARRFAGALRARASLAALVRISLRSSVAIIQPRGFAPRTPRHALSHAASPA